LKSEKKTKNTYSRTLAVTDFTIVKICRYYCKNERGTLLYLTDQSAGLPTRHGLEIAFIAWRYVL